MSKTGWWTVERNGEAIQCLGHEDIEGWMQNHAIRKSSGVDGDPDVAIAPDGTRWVQLGYVLLPEGGTE